MSRGSGVGEPGRNVAVGVAGDPAPRGDRVDGEVEGSPEVSIIVLVSERPDDLREIYRSYRAVMKDSGRSFEFLFVLEAWRDEQREEVEELVAAGEPVRMIVTGQGAGEAALLRLGANASRGRRIVTLPGYRRVEAGAVTDLLRALDDEADLALARRHPRPDSWINRVQTRAFHFLLRWSTGVRLDDVGCGVRAMHRRVLDEVPLYGDFHRFLPVFADREGYRVVQVDVPQHPDDRQTRVYSPGVYLRRLIDLLGVFFLTRFTFKPLRFFGLVGAGLGSAGAAILLVLFFQRIGGQGIADRPMLLLGVLLATLGVQAFALGLIGEIIVHFHVPRHRYRLEEEPGAGSGDDGEAP